MKRLVIAIAFGMSCMVFAALGAWFWLHGRHNLGGMLLLMIPGEMLAALAVFAALARRGE